MPYLRALKLPTNSCHTITWIELAYIFHAVSRNFVDTPTSNNSKMEKELPPMGGDQNRKPISIVVEAILISLCVVIVPLRFCARYIGSIRYSWDDWSMLMALVRLKGVKELVRQLTRKKGLALIHFGLAIAALDHGQGRHAYYLDLNRITRVQKLVYVGEITTTLNLCLVKISVVLFLLRIGGLRRWLKFALLATATLLVVSTLVFVILLLVQCKPFAANWDPRIRLFAMCLSPSASIDIAYCSSGIESTNVSNIEAD